MMTQTPLRRLAERLFHDRAEEIEFLEAIKAGGNHCRAILHKEDIDCPKRSDWTPHWVSLSERPTRHDYSLDLSDIWRLSPLSIMPSRPKRILDLCAAPGGMTLAAARYFPEAELLSNDVAANRADILVKNLKSFLGKKRAKVLNSSLDELVEKVAGGFDLVIVDPPCSDQARMADGSEDSGCFDPLTVKGNATRQMQILEQALKLVSPGGYLLYTTGTFSIGENEFVIDTVLESHPDFETVDLGPVFKSDLTSRPYYRLYPQNGLGLGGCTSLHQRVGEVGPLSEIPKTLTGVAV